MNVILKFISIVQGNVAVLASKQIMISLLLFGGGGYFTMLEIPGLYMICSKSFGTFEIVRQLDVLIVLVKLFCLVACFLIIILFAMSSCCD
jgi:hypothetical protein